MNRITADGDTIMIQASTTITTYLLDAVESIDNQFERGYAENHPELVVAFMKAATMDEIGVVIAQQLREGLTEVAEAIQGLK